MRRVSTLWKANTIAFISSFCVMVIELIAARMLAPYIGVSLYTWTSIIGVILAGIALGNYLGGKLADRWTSSMWLVAVFLAGSLATVAIIPTTRSVGLAGWFDSLPLMLDFVLKVTCIFFLPALILSMVSPVVIKLALADLGQTGGIVGTIYACSTVGAILGTFMTGFYLILWFGTRTIVWLVAAILLLTGLVSLFSWSVPDRWRLSWKNIITWTVIIAVILTFTLLFQHRQSWQEYFTRESNYYTIRVLGTEEDVKMLVLDHLVHSYNIPENPTYPKYEYLKIFAEMTKYVSNGKSAPRVLHLGGGGYSFPRYIEAVYPQSVNDVVEIDPVVTQVAHEELGLPLATSIKTYNLDARLFLIQRKTADKYNIVIGDVFNDFSTPYHLTTLEFDRLVKAQMERDGIYMVNLIDNYTNGRYLPSFMHTLSHAFDNIYLFSTGMHNEYAGTGTFVIAATDRHIDLADYREFFTGDKGKEALGDPRDKAQLEDYLAARDPILLTDDYAPTDILMTKAFR